MASNWSRKCYKVSLGVVFFRLQKQPISARPFFCNLPPHGRAGPSKIGLIHGKYRQLRDAALFEENLTCCPKCWKNGSQNEPPKHQKSIKYHPGDVWKTCVFIACLRGRHFIRNGFQNRTYLALISAPYAVLFLSPAPIPPKTRFGSLFATFLLAFSVIRNPSGHFFHTISTQLLLLRMKSYSP